MLWSYSTFGNIRINRYALGLNIIVSVLFILALINLAPGTFQMASALKPHTHRAGQKLRWLTVISQLNVAHSTLMMVETSLDLLNV